MASLGALEEGPLWRHSNPSSTCMWKFRELIKEKYQLNLESYQDLHKWSVDHINEFWEEVWGFTGIKASKRFEKLENDFFFASKPGTKALGNVKCLVLDQNVPMFPRPDFFQGSLLNFAENLLYPANVEINPDAPAIISATESTRSITTWKELRERVGQCASALRSLGIKRHDCVTGFLGNHSNTVVAMLAATSVGAIWTGISPDTGVTAVLDRLVQIEPVLLFADNGVEYNGRFHESISKTRDIARELKQLKAVVIFKTLENVSVNIEGVQVALGQAWTYEDFVKSSNDLSAPLEFTQLPPSHPIYILYSSGTTGKPKCIIHSSIGTLIQHKKEHILHCAIRPQDRLFYYTTCTWMMWHWLVTGLASGATIVLYDGSPFKPHSNLSVPRLIEELKITQFGASAKYLSILEQSKVFPLSEGIDLSSLRAIYSTGSPLAPSTFRYVYSAFPETLNLGSITGGTDIISLFGAPSPLSPVYAGEVQAPGLGMALQAFDPTGKAITNGEAGELVCVKPFPCQPVGFFGADGETKYRESYFETFPNVWHHGDFIRFNPKTGGLVMLGRSDGILKPSGVRFGSAEIYNVLLKHFAAEVEDALCIGWRREGDGDEAVVLFVKMKEGEVLSEDLRAHIKNMIRSELSGRHVPGVIDQCFEIPVTPNGKKVEVAVKQILCGMTVKTSASVANSSCLEWYREWARTH